MSELHIVLHMGVDCGRVALLGFDHSFIGEGMNLHLLVELSQDAVQPPNEIGNETRMETFQNRV